ncbi:MAG: mannose-6-phosphate isomerase, class I, partial [Ilumatobacteraceae bacterium]
QPGQAIFLDAGNLHAYLHGVGVEAMGNSDNVLRGGFTPKHVDADELLRIADLRSLADPLVDPTEVSAGEFRYDTPGAPFRFTRWEIDVPRIHTAGGRELLLCTSGSAGSTLGRGTAAYLAAGDCVELTGPATVFQVAETG